MPVPIKSGSLGKPQVHIVIALYGQGGTSLPQADAEAAGQNENIGGACSTEGSWEATREVETLAPSRLELCFHLNILLTGFCGASVIHSKFRWARNRTLFSAIMSFLTFSLILLGRHI